MREPAASTTFRLRIDQPVPEPPLSEGLLIDVQNDIDRNYFIGLRQNSKALEHLVHLHAILVIVSGTARAVCGLCACLHAQE